MSAGRRSRRLRRISAEPRSRAIKNKGSLERGAPNRHTLSNPQCTLPPSQQHYLYLSMRL